MPQPGPSLSLGQYTARVLIFLLLAGLLYLLWTMRELVILVFGGVLVGVIFSLLAEPLQRQLGLPRWAALLITIAVLAIVAVGSAALFGRQIATEAATIRTELPEALEALRARLEPFGLERVLSNAGTDALLARLGSFALSIGSGVADVILALVAGIYFAAQPGLYRRGVLKLIPETGRAQVAAALDDSAAALRLWLGAQLVAMSIVGALTGIGLWLLGVPGALILGLIAALLDFVPTFGPIIAAIPGILIAFFHAPELALWTAGLYLLIQQLEGNLITPIVQQKAINLPPALLLFALVAGGLTFGLAGVLLAAPLTVVLLVIVKRLYVRGALHTPTRLPTDQCPDLAAAEAESRSQAGGG